MELTLNLESWLNQKVRVRVRVEVRIRVRVELLELLE